MQYGIDKRTDGLGIGDVRRHSEGTPPDGLDIAGNRVQLVSSSRCEHDIGARCGERQSHRPPQASTCPGDDRDLARQRLLGAGHHKTPSSRALVSLATISLCTSFVPS